MVEKIATKPDARTPAQLRAAIAAAKAAHTVQRTQNVQKRAKLNALQKEIHALDQTCRKLFWRGERTAGKAGV